MHQSSFHPPFFPAFPLHIHEPPKRPTQTFKTPSKHSAMTTLTLTLSLTIIFLFSLSPTPLVSAKKTAYEVLEEYDFPIGLLPNGVLGYELNSSTGAFKVYLNGTCTFSLDSYELKYKSTISGVISKDKIKSLKGISVKILFFWLSIVEVIRDGDEIEFSVGIASADFPVSNFYKCPTCGCGFDCVGKGTDEKRKKMKLRLNGLVSSS
ncbi:hypothetical protein Ancab_021856 [Ancistrocladus abbreviatus]